jgi:hypothetical protein
MAAEAFLNMASLIKYNNKDPSLLSSSFTSNDFKLHKERSLTSNKLGTKERI